MTPQESTRERLEKQLPVFEIETAGGKREVVMLDDVLPVIESECTLREERGREEEKRKIEKLLGKRVEYITADGNRGQLNTEFDIAIKAVLSLLSHPEVLTDKEK